MPFGLGVKLLGVMAILAAVHLFMNSLVERGRAEVAAKYAQAAQQETERRLQARVEIDNEAHRMQARNLAGRLALTAAAPSLRSAATGAISASCPTVAAVGSSAASAAGVLADVLGEAEERLQLLAAEVDAARTAGLVCEAAYRSLTP